MDIEMLLLNDRIEQLRENLYVLLISNSLTSPRVVEYSQKLDKLLTQYEKCICFCRNNGLKTA